MRSARGVSAVVAGLLIGGVAFAVAPAAHAAATLDQANVGSFGPAFIGFSAGSPVAQTFTAGMSGPLVRVGIGVRIVGVTSLRVAIYDVSVDTGKPTTELTSEVLTGGRLTMASSPGMLMVDFASPVTVNAGTKYAIVVKDPVGAGGSWYELNASPPSFEGPYTAGAPYANSSWILDSWVDTIFETYVDVPGGLSDGAPSILQQLPAGETGSCDAVADGEYNWGGAGSGGWSKSWAQWANGGNGGPVCTRVLRYNSYSGVWQSTS